MDILKHFNYLVKMIWVGKSWILSWKLKLAFLPAINILTKLERVLPAKNILTTLEAKIEQFLSERKKG